jgi:predicted metalloprotease
MGRRESDRVEDVRGVPGGRLAIGGCGTLILAIVISLLTGVDPLRLLEVIGGSSPSASEVSSPAGGSAEGAPEADDPAKKFVAVVLADTEDTWTSLFAARGDQYEQPRLVLFSGATRTGCGFGESQMGPFYCPRDHKVYLDLSFFQELDRRFGAPGDFAQAYVIAHEVGHHVQDQLGIAGKVDALRSRASEEQSNQLSVLMELQADCLAGVWGHHGAARGLLEPGDAEEGLRAAAAIGDDRMQRMATGSVQPESWTHGSSQQRVEWLRRGLQSGDPGVCDTFQGVF